MSIFISHPITTRDAYISPWHGVWHENCHAITTYYYTCIFIGNLCIFSLISLKYIVALILKEKFEDTKWVIRIHEEKYNGKKKKDKTTKNGLQNIHIKLKIE